MCTRCRITYTLLCGAYFQETLTQIPHLQEAFNAETGMIEQAEIVTQVSSFDSTQGNIFTLASSDFAENHLTLQVILFINYLTVSLLYLHTCVAIIDILKLKQFLSVILLNYSF